MPLYVGTTPVTLQALHVGDTAISRLYHGNDLVWDVAGGGSAPATLATAVTGDSTIAEYPVGQGIVRVSSLVAGLDPLTDIAVPGHTIGQQRALWEALGDYSAFELVIVQLGLNNITGSGTAAGTIAALQGYVDRIRADVEPGCLIYVSKMLPCRQRWIDLFGTSGGAVAQQQWADLNAAIAGEGSTPISGVDGRIVSHVPLLGDSDGNLKPIYDTSDHIHENNAARQIIANAWRSRLVADGRIA